MTTPVLSVSALVLAVFALHGLVLGGVLLRSAQPPRAARWCLSALVLVIAVLLADMAVAYSEASLGLVVHGLVGSLWFAVGPLFYGYVRGLLPGRAGWEAEDVLHAVPLALQLVVVGAVLGTPAVTPEAAAAARPVVAFVFFVLYGLQTAAYAAVAARVVGGYAERYRREAAGPAEDRLVGLRRVASLFGVYAGAVVLNGGVWMATGAPIGWLDYLVPFALAVLVGAVGVGLLRGPAVLLPALSLPPPEPAPPPAPGGPAPDLVRHADALRALMETERLYLDPDVRLGTLAARLGVSERTLSLVLAEAVGGTFYDVVNGYRVAEAQARLADPALAHQTVLAIGLDAGFSSKASFNRVFKRVTGETPSAYRQRAAATGPARPDVAVNGGGGVREAEAA